MTGDDFRVFLAQKLRRLTCNKAMRSAVETVSSNLMFLIQFVGYGIYLRVIFHFGIVRRIEYAHVIDVWHDFLTRLETADCGWTVQGIQPDDAFQIRDFFIAKTDDLRNFSPPCAKRCPTA